MRNQQNGRFWLLSKESLKLKVTPDSHFCADCMDFQRTNKKLSIGVKWLQKMETAKRSAI